MQQLQENNVGFCQCKQTKQYHTILITAYRRGDIILIAMKVMMKLSDRCLIGLMLKVR